MGNIEDWFPYDSFRPNQETMLNTAAEAAREKKICLIDAPTGSGKSSIISAMLANANGRKIVVAVRTVSQLNIFIREIGLIKRKKRVKAAYLIGKRNMCPMTGEGDIYHLCEGLKSFSSSIMRDRAQKGSLVPANDAVIKNQIKRQDPDRPLLCPYYIKSKVFVENDGMKMIPSNGLRAKGEEVSKSLVNPDRIKTLCNEICPYEVMLQAARDADIILLNFHHLFNETIREQMYLSIGIEENNTMLLIDEAHNCSDTVQSIQTISISEKTLDHAQNELTHMKSRIKGVEAVQGMLPRVRKFMDGLRRSVKKEDYFDPAMFSRFILNESLYSKMEDIYDDLNRIYEAIKEKKIQEGDFKEIPLERVMEFFFRIIQATKDPAFLTIYKKNDNLISLEVRNIDPASTLKEIAKNHSSCIMISGTLSPVESFKKLYFEDTPAVTLSLPNSFPKKNRAIYCSKDVTSTFSKRKDKDNLERIHRYIQEFAKVKGNLAVYFPSYDMLNNIAVDIPQKINGKEVFIESPEAQVANRDLRKFLSLPETGKSGIIFGVCGGKWSEGLDYRGDLLNGAIVIGLPLAPYNDVRKMVIDYFRSKFGPEGEFISYTLPAINKALQALGRVLRTPDDTGVLLIGEARFLESGVKKGLPPWMQDEMVVCDISQFSKDMTRWR